MRPVSSDNRIMAGSAIEETKRNAGVECSRFANSIEGADDADKHENRKNAAREHFVAMPTMGVDSVDTDILSRALRAIATVGLIQSIRSVFLLCSSSWEKGVQPCSSMARQG